MKNVFGVDIEALAWVFSLSGFGSIAYHLWMGEDISVRKFIGAIMLSSIFGALVFLWLSKDVQEPTKLIAISIFAGIGATTFIDIILATASRYGSEWIKKIVNRRL